MSNRLGSNRESKNVPITILYSFGFVFGLGSAILIYLALNEIFILQSERDGPNLCEMTYMHPNYYPIQFYSEEAPPNYQLFLYRERRKISTDSEMKVPFFKTHLYEPIYRTRSYVGFLSYLFQEMLEVTNKFGQ